MKYLLSLCLILFLFTPSALYADGFDWGSSCEGGAGTFTQRIAESSDVRVGQVPADRANVEIRLTSDEDVDIRLVDEATGHEIISWPGGALSGASEECTTYYGVVYCYSGFNGDGENYGHEWIRVSGTTNRPLKMSAFGYQSGHATVDYSWDARSGCEDSGSGEFSQWVPRRGLATVGTIPAGKENVAVTLVAQNNTDIDVQLFDGDTKIVAWDNSGVHGILHGASEESVTYGGMRITYSGYNGRNGRWGHEDIVISGVVTRPLTMKVFGYQAGHADVTYSWGADSSSAPSTPSLVFVAMGDFGTGGTGQDAVAEALENVCESMECGFVVGLGDNIYSDGITSVQDSLLQDNFEVPYRNLDFPFYMSLGNHDHRSDVNAQVSYTNYSDKWIMPSRYYSFTKSAGATSIQFFAIDTMGILQSASDRRAQREWLIDGLESSTADWKVVFGHHPWRSNGSHGDADPELESFFEQTLCGRADLLLSGHDHDKQHLRSVCGVQLVLSGAGAKLRSVSHRSNTLFARSSLGFGTFEVKEDSLALKFFDEESTQEYQATLTKQ